MISITQGGFFFYAIGVLGFVVLLIAIERYLKLGVFYRLNSRRFIQKVRDAFVTDNFKEIDEKAQSYKNKPLARLVNAGVRHRHQSSEELHLSLEAEIAQSIPLIEKRVNALSTLANISTLLGLVGTVVGLIKSFGAIGNQVAEAAARSQALAAGVSESMMTTAAGLIVAIPALLFHLHISGIARKLIADLDFAALEVKKLALGHRKVEEILRKSAIQPIVTKVTEVTQGSQPETFDEATVVDHFITKTERKG
jgi:biopolymer transport protein ExbB/TolQ